MIECRNLSKTYSNKKTALKEFSAVFQSGKSYAVYGPSGSGKTTLLSLLAGLIKPGRGEVIRSADLKLSMVFQKDLLLEHLSAEKNILYGLKNGTHRQKMEQVEKTAGLCACSSYLQQRAGTLSGGQKQRVALARALVSNPDVLLMDEPFSHMDPGLKFDLLWSVKELQKKMDFTLIFVTHDINEARSAADLILFLQHGRLQQTGTWQQLYLYPANIHVASGFLYPGMNLLQERSGWMGFYPDTLLPEKEGEVVFSIEEILWRTTFGNLFLFCVSVREQTIKILWPGRTLPEKVSIKKSSIYTFDAAGNSTGYPVPESV